MCFGLIAAGAVGLSIRLLTSLGTGDVSCILTGDKQTIKKVDSNLFFWKKKLVLNADYVKY